MEKRGTDSFYLGFYFQTFTEVVAISVSLLDLVSQAILFHRDSFWSRVRFYPPKILEKSRVDVV